MVKWILPSLLTFSSCLRNLIILYLILWGDSNITQFWINHIPSTSMYLIWTLNWVFTKRYHIMNPRCGFYYSWLLEFFFGGHHFGFFTRFSFMDGMVSYEKSLNREYVTLSWEALLSSGEVIGDEGRLT